MAFMIHLHWIAKKTNSSRAQLWWIKKMSGWNSFYRWYETRHKQKFTVNWNEKKHTTQIDAHPKIEQKKACHILLSWKTLLCVILFPITLRFQFYLKICFYLFEFCAGMHRNKMWNVTESSARSIYGTNPNEWKIANNAGTNENDDWAQASNQVKERQNM